jgi:hypothetical protein
MADPTILAKQHYFIPIRDRDFDGPLFSKSEALAHVDLRLLVEGVHVDDVQAVIVDTCRNYGQTVLPSRTGGVVTGRLIQLWDILYWAIEHGYLDDPERYRYEDFPQELLPDEN